MSIQARINELEARHKALKEQVAQEQALPTSDDLKIAEMKREKLWIKDEIARLKAQDAA